MASLSSSSRLGNTSTSSLLRSAATIQNEINSYNDSIASYQYELSPKTNQDLATYSRYLDNRIKMLRSTGSITDASKALTLSKTLTGAVRSNTTANIQRENIQVMAGNASLQDKYNTVVSQFQRAVAIGDMSLAQQLESQAYSISQSIQYQAAQAQQASEALARAATSSSIYAQQGIIKALDESMKNLTNAARQGGGEKAIENVTGAFVNGPESRKALQALGVVIPKGAQPNYWDLVNGIVGAKYNALVLEAQAKASTDPKGASALLYEAQNLQTGATKIGGTLAGSLTIQEIQQAAADPNMFAYDYGTGSYKRTAKVGYQYITDPQTGKPYVAPIYSGIVGDAKRNQIYFLNPQQTAELTGLGIKFSANKNGTTGDGVSAQLSDTSPQWLKNLLGNGGVTNVYVDKAGNLQFEGPSTSGTGLAYFTLVNIGGLSGAFEHSPDGSSKLVGGNYGFDAGAAQLLINYGEQKQYQLKLQAEAERKAQLAKIALATPKPLPQLKVSAPVYKAPSIQPATYNPQPATYNPQPASTSSTKILQPATQYHSNVQGVPLTQPKLPGISL